MAATKDIIFAILFFAVLVFNIAGNSLVIYIITNKRGMKTSTNYLLLNLAVADLLFGVFLVPEYIFLPFFRGSLPDGVLGDWLCRLLLSSNIALVMGRASIFTMICLSVERYFAVCRPHSFSQRFSPKIVKVLVMVSWIYAVVVASPFFVSTNLERKDELDFPVCLLKSSIFQAYSVYSMLELTCALSLMIFLLLKIFISLWCKQAVEATGEREITERKKKKKVTLCVLAVLVTFILCWIPLYAHYAITGLRRTLDLTPITLVASINASLDPYLFSFQSSRFKALVQKLFCCKKELP